MAAVVRHQPHSFVGMAGGEDSHTYTRTRLELSWQEFVIRNPSNRSSKRSPTQTEFFKYKLSKEPLWMDSRCNPSWVKNELVARGFVAELCIGPASAADAFPPSLIWACCKNKDLARGTRLHNELQKKGLAEQKYSDALVTMYAKCGELHKAKALLDMHNNSSIIPWTALIAGYARQGQGRKALDCFQQLQHKGIPPDAIIYASILKACAVIGDIDKGKQIHNEISRQGLLKHDMVLGGALVDMYAKCGTLPLAQSVLENLPCRNVVSWSALIAGYAQKGQGQQALECFKQMQHEGVPPDAVTYVSILKACAAIGANDKGKQIHDEILRQGLLEDSAVLGGALVHMYAKCGALPQAQSVLEKLPSGNIIPWNALIAGYVQKGQTESALDCFEQLKRKGISPDAMTYICILKACAMIGAIDKGKQIHVEILRQGLLLEHDIFLGGALVDMYAKCGALPEALGVLEKLPFRDVVSWSALISGYAQMGQGQQALECFKQMKLEGIYPDAVTYACVLRACAVIGAIDKGKQIHDEILSQGLLKHNIVLGSALVDMYAKCGALPQAQNVLEKLPSRNIVSWNALIAGYGQEGQCEQALKCFEHMPQEAILPDIVTFQCLLNLCNHLGLVEKGQELFDNMGLMYGLKPDVECLTCMVDLLGRAGHLMKAVDLIQEMPFSADSGVWHCLLDACQKWADAKVGSWAFEQAVKLDRWDGGAYVLMESIYATAGMLEKAKDIEAMRIKNIACK